MTTYFPETEKFMKERDIPVAKLSIISLSKLRTKDSAELALLDEAASNTGFFYLDLRGDSQGERLLGNLPAIQILVENYFGQPEEAKAKDARFDIKAWQDLGWKKRYGGESFEISRDEIALPADCIPHLPQLFRNEWEKITDIGSDCDDACLTLLKSLSPSFSVYHDPHKPSDTGLKMVLHPSCAKKSDAPDDWHTDDGTLTLLFYKDWGLNLFLPDVNMWAFTPPMEGCALINVASSLQKLSGGRLHSAKHRVTQPFDGAKNRYYFSYFLRPETVLVEKWNSDK